MMFCCLTDSVSLAEKAIGSQKRDLLTRVASGSGCGSQVSPSAVSDINANSNKQLDNCNVNVNVLRHKVACPLCENEMPAERSDMEQHLIKVRFFCTRTREQSWCN